jgi:hypothetical protein
MEDARVMIASVLAPGGRSAAFEARLAGPVLLT